MTSAAQDHLPWEDRWTQPAPEQLVEAIDEQRRSYLRALDEQTVALEDVRRSVIWQGTSWKWTFQFLLDKQEAGEPEVLAYLVPRPQNPIYCVPLRDQTIEALPTRRLNKYIREGIRVAKRGVDLHWGTWNPSANTEVEYLMDLVKRKRKLLLGEAGGGKKR